MMDCARVWCRCACQRRACAGGVPGASAPGGPAEHHPTRPPVEFRGDPEPVLRVRRRCTCCRRARRPSRTTSPSPCRRSSSGCGVQALCTYIVTYVFMTVSLFSCAALQPPDEPAQHTQPAHVWGSQRSRPRPCSHAAWPVRMPGPAQLPRSAGQSWRLHTTMLQGARRAARAHNGVHGPAALQTLRLQLGEKWSDRRQQLVAC